MSKFDLSIRVCSNYKHWMQLKSNPVMGFCGNSESGANGSQMYKHSTCSEIILKRVILKEEPTDTKPAA